MAYIPNPDKPSSVSTIRRALDELAACRSGGGFNLAKLDRWMQTYPEQLEEAAEEIDAVLDEHYPPDSPA
ncbi:hypothetical protein [Cohnella sp. JJ-181]|uniref:hypothetical protein n=1 Tax=Cohnella rhizoplanae TaxID=2974897 RepID=UPI00232E8582|nr:hypothetical protein [Cohnella sp. JJ-181]